MAVEGLAVAEVREEAGAAEEAGRAREQRQSFIFRNKPQKGLTLTVCRGLPHTLSQVQVSGTR